MVKKKTKKNLINGSLAIIVAIAFTVFAFSIWSLLRDSFTHWQLIITTGIIIVLSIVFGRSKFKEIPKLFTR